MIESKKNTNNLLGGQTHKTERSGVAVIMAWMREIIEKHNLDLGLPDVEMSGSDRKMPDLEINAYLLVNKILFYDLVQAKRPDKKFPPMDVSSFLTSKSQLNTISSNEVNCTSLFSQPNLCR